MFSVLRVCLALVPLLAATLRGQDAASAGGEAVRTAEGILQEASAEAEEVPSSEEAAARKESRVISASRQFVVTGGDGLVAGAVATKAEEIRGGLLKLLSLPKTWKHRIHIVLQGRADAPASPRPIRTRINILAGEPSYEIRILMGGGINLEKLHAVIVAMLLYERSLREIDPEALPDEVELPAWLLTGINQAIQWNAGRIDRSVYTSLFSRSEMLSPEQLLSYKSPETLDASSRLLYDTSCGVLVMCLLNQKGGRDALLTLLDQAALGEGSPREMIERNFQSFHLDENAFHKWWALQLAQLSTPMTTESLSPAETERRLADALLLIRYDEETRTPIPVSLDDVELAVSLPDWKAQSRRVLDQLVHLSVRCFPAYRPVITEYCRLIADLQHGMPPEEAIQMIGPLIELREACVSAALRARDYLDWYEITHLGGKSGSFSSYLEAMKILRAEPDREKTPLSGYLDDIQSLYRLPAHAPLPASLRQRLGKEGRE